ncbi:MAG: hypothetical protein AB2A00_26045 [Myxococcota bacterium]
MHTVMHSRLVSCLVVFAVLGAVGCRKSAVGSPDTVLLLRPVTGEGGKVLLADAPGGGRWPVLQRAAPDDAVTVAAQEALDKQHAAESVAVLKQLKTYLRTRLGEGKGADKALVATAGGASAVVLGAPEGLPQRGAFLREGDDDKPAPELLWTPLPAADLDVPSGTLEQSLAGRIARLSMWLVLDRVVREVPAEWRATLVGSPWFVSDPVSALVEGYGLHVETVARRASRSGKLGPPGSVEGAKDDAAARVAAVMGGRYAYRAPEPPGALDTPQARGAFLDDWARQRPPQRGEVWRGSQMVCVAGVVANVLNALGDDPAVGLGVPASSFFAPFHGGKVPEDLDPRKLSPTLVVELKILHALHERLGQPNPPPMPGIHTVVEAFTLAFPGEREAALRALMSGTFARTADTRSVGTLEAAGAALNVTQEVLSGGRFPDGAVGPAIMVRLPSVTVVRGGVEVPLVFNLNAALPWELDLIPGMPRDYSAQLHARLEKMPLGSIDELAGKIPAEAYSALVAVKAGK